jgi:hypothetical protein
MEKYDFEFSDEFLSNAIDYHIGDIRNIPAIAQGEIRRVYQDFFSAYHKIAMQMPMRKNVDILKDYRLNPKVIEYMRHFFSDYQVLYREFSLLNRNAGALLKIDRDADPAGFWEQLELLLAGKINLAENEVLNELMGQENPKES